MHVIRKLLVVAATWLLGAHTPVLAQTTVVKKEVKLAIVDVGVKDKVPLAFVDFLTVAFAKQSAIALLERSDVDRLLREQSLSLSLSSAIRSDAAVRSGKLWAVDAFLMLEAGMTPNGLASVRIRLVDAHHGMKVLDDNLLLPADGKIFPERANGLAKLAVQKLAGFKADAVGVRLIGVAALESKEVSKSWDWLSESLAAGLEQHLGLEPSVILMERAKTRTLSDERNLAEGLPEGLKASAVLVTGGFKLERGKGLDAISVSIQCRSGGKIVLERTVEGSLHHSSVIAQKLAKEIAAGLPGGPGALRSMSPEAEARMLADQARAHFASSSWIYDPEQALAPTEAALALMPNSNDYRYMLLTILDAQMSYRSREKGYSHEAGWRHALAYCARAIPAAEQLIARPDNNVPATWPHAISRLFTHHAVHHWQWVGNAPRGSIKDDDAAKETRAALRALYAKGMALPRNLHSYFEDAASNDYLWCETPEQALKQRLDRLEAANAAFERVPNPVVPGGILPSRYLYHHFSLCPQWAARPDVEQLYIDYLATLCKHKGASVRLAGELHAAFFHNCEPGRIDYEKARKHYRTALDMLKTEIQPQAPHGAREYSWWIYSPLGNGRFAKDGMRNTEITIEFMRDALDFFLADQTRFQELEYWTSLLRAHTESLRSLGRQDEAYRYLQGLAQHFQGVKLTGRNDANILPDMMADLTRRYPSMRAAEDWNSPYKAEPVLFVKNLKATFPDEPWTRNSISFKRLIVEDKVTAIVCIYTSGQPSENRVGLLRLDSETLKPVSFVEYPAEFKVLTGSEVSDAAIAVVGADVYVGSVNSGIVCFPAHGPARAWSEKTGLASNQIRSLAFLGHTLYAAVGAHDTYMGLIDLDLDTGRSSVLFSSKAKNSPHELDGRAIKAVVADPERQCLWLGVLPKRETKDKSALFAYYPREQKTVRKMDAERGLEFLVSSQGKVFMGAGTYALSLDLKTAEIKAVLFADGIPSYIPFKAPRTLHFGRYSGNRKMVEVGKNLIYLDRETVYGGSLTAMAEGDEKSTPIFEKCFPGRPETAWLRDLAMSGQGLLILDHDALFRSPGIKVVAEDTKSR